MLRFLDPPVAVSRDELQQHRYGVRVTASAAVERWFKTTKPPAEAAMRIVRRTILAADASMTERIQYGNLMFASTKSGDFAAFVAHRQPGVNLMLMRGGRLTGRYPHLEGPTVKRLRVADEEEANARAAELTAMVKEWCALGAAAGAPAKKAARTTSRGATAGRSARPRATRPSGGARRS